jgi:phosphonate transport system substrate-binding protein
VQGQLVVLDESPIRKMADLEGMEVVFANPNAFLGYFVPMDAILKAKIKVKPLLSVNQEAAMGQLKAGRAAAAGVNSDVMRDFARRESFRYRVIWASPDYLGLPLAAHPKVSKDKVNAVRDAFVGMGSDPEGMRILATSSAVIKQKPLPGFLAATDKDYENVVEFYRTSLVTGQ